MLAYILNRILIMIPTLFLISVISFIVIDLPPGDMASAYLSRMEDQREELSEETMRQVDALRARFGLDQPGWKLSLIHI